MTTPQVRAAILGITTTAILAIGATAGPASAHAAPPVPQGHGIGLAHHWPATAPQCSPRPGSTPCQGQLWP